MEGDLARIAAAQGGFCYRWQALECGYKPAEIDALLRQKLWRRVRRGAYTTPEIFGGLDAPGLHLLTARAVVGNLDGPAVLSHVTAMAAHGVPLWGVDLRRIHVVRGPGVSTRHCAGVVHHHGGALTDAEVMEVGGLLVTRPERSLVDACRISSFEPGVVMADGARRLDRFDVQLAYDVVDRQRDWSGSVTASRALAFSADGAQTIGESRSRILLARSGVPSPVLQFPVYDESGRLTGISDMYVEEFDTLVEFDGMVKYGRELYERTGQLSLARDLGEVLWQEKRREDGMRDLGKEMIRLVWSELDGHDAQVRARFDRTFARNDRRRRWVG